MSGNELYLAVTSKASAHLFPNTGSRFSNILAEKLDLDPNTSYEVGLLNHHIPKYCSILNKNDHVTSNIQYNIGLFYYDHDKKGFDIDPQKNRKLFSLAPNKDVHGVYESGEDDKIDHSNPLHQSDNQNVGGRNSIESQRETFLQNLNNSLELENDEQKKSFELIQKQFKYRLPEKEVKLDTMGAHYYSQFNVLTFNDLFFIDQENIHYFMSQLMEHSGLVRHQQGYQTILDRIFNLEPVEVVVHDEVEGAGDMDTSPPASTRVSRSTPMEDMDFGVGSDAPVELIAAQARAEKAIAVAEDDEEDSAFFNKPRLIPYPSLVGTVLMLNTPDSYANFLKHVSKKKCMYTTKKAGERFTSEQVGSLNRSGNSVDRGLMKSKMRGECKRSAEEANGRVRSDIKKNLESPAR